MTSLSSNNTDLSFLSLWKERVVHHCVLLPSLYGIKGCAILLKYLTHTHKLSSQGVLSSPDFLFHTTFVEDSLPLNIEHVRKLTSYAQNTAMGNGKVIVLQNIETASHSALNALLKIVEEPPRGTTFYMIYSDVNAVPKTIRSRGVELHEKPFTQTQFNTVAKFLEVPEDYHLFTGCGYDFATYSTTISIADLSFQDAFARVQSKGFNAQELFAFLEYKLAHFAREEANDIRPFKALKHIFEMKKKIRNLKINEQVVLLQLLEEVHALVGH